MNAAFNNPEPVPTEDEDEVTFTVTYKTKFEDNSHRMDHYA
jgi:hypothetical protein